VHDIIVLPAEAYSIQEEARLEIAPAFIAPILKVARREGWSLVLTHSHPFSSDPSFSLTDDRGETLLMPALHARAPDRPHGSLVLGRDGFQARLWSPNARQAPVAEIADVGDTLRLYAKSPESESLQLRFDRSVRALGVAGQQVVRRLRVGVVGLGGTGSFVVQQLAHLGVRKFVLIDSDVVDETSLNRLIGATSADIGLPKVLVAARVVRGLLADSSVEPIVGSVLLAKDARPLLGLDFLFGCTDTHGSRAVINQLAYQYLIPTIDLGVRVDATGGVIRAIAGRVQLLAPGLACLLCQELLDPEAVRRDLLLPEQRARDPYIIGADEPQPSVVSINGTIASLGVSMFLAVVAGMPLQPRHLVYLGERGSVRPVQSTPRSDCIVCSTNGSLARGDLSPLPWRLA